MYISLNLERMVWIESVSIPRVKTYILSLHLQHHLQLHANAEIQSYQENISGIPFSDYNNNKLFFDSIVIVCLFQLNVNIALRRSNDVSSANAMPPH